jgi:hypothetical protein
VHADTLKGLVVHKRGGPSREILGRETCSVRGPAGLKQGEAHRVRMPSVALVKEILSAGPVTADFQAGKASGPVVEDRCLAVMERAVAEKSVAVVDFPVAVERTVAVNSAAGVDSRAAADSMEAVDSVAAALAEGIDK